MIHSQRGADHLEAVDRYPGRGTGRQGMRAGDASQQRKNKKDNKNIVDNKNVVCYIEITPNAKGIQKMQKTGLQAANDIKNEVGISQKRLAEKMGLKSQQAVYNMLNAKNGMRIDNFVRMMEVLGYDVIIRNRVTDEEIEIIAKGDEAE